MDNILFIQTGGTIDKDYPTGKAAYAFEIAEPAVGRILKKIKPTFEYRIVELLKKDSTDLTDDDRKLILETCAGATEQYIVITHGTDTMRQTAAFVNGLEGKTVIITGSMRPERLVESDADFNLGTAIGAIGHLPTGIYIAMSGQVLPWDKTEKDYARGQFVPRG